MKARYNLLEVPSLSRLCIRIQLNLARQGAGIGLVEVSVATRGIMTLLPVVLFVIARHPSAEVRTSKALPISSGFSSHCSRSWGTATFPMLLEL